MTKGVNMMNLSKLFNFSSIKTKLIVLMLLSIIIISVVSGVYIYTKEKVSLEGQIEKKLEAVIYNAKHLLGDYHDRITDETSITDEEYTQVIRRWNTICEELDLMYIWSMMMVDGELHTTSGTSADKIVENGQHYQFFQLPDEELGSRSLKTIQQNSAVADSLETEWGAMYLLSIPFKDSHGRVYTLNASMSMEFVKNKLNRIMWVTILASFAFLTIIGAIASIILTKLVKPIIELRNLAQVAGKGDLTVTVDQIDNSEIGNLATSFNEMINNLRSLVISSQEIADETLTTTDNMVGMISNTSDSMESIAISMNEIAHGATEQAEQAEVAVNKVALLDEHVQDIDSNTRETKEEMALMQEMIIEGTKIIDDLIIKQGTSKDAISKINSIVDVLGQQLEKVSVFTVTISHIADQTNLLALNAAIEAARAGESGKGFAVVAEEVRKLAEEANASSNEIRDVINYIHGDMQEAVQSVKQAILISEEQSVAVTNTGDIFTKIDEAVKVSTDDIQNIYDKMDTLLDIKNGVVHSMGAISAVTEETAASTEEISALVEEQNESMTTIKQNVGELKLSSTDMKALLTKFKS